MLAFGIRYLNGFVAASEPDSYDRPEWPPHPGRVFMALAAAHFETGADPKERTALEWMERIPMPPTIRADEATARALVTHFVPVGDKAIWKKDPAKPEKGPPPPLQSAPGIIRVKNERTFARAWLDNEVVYVYWPEAEPSYETRDVLETLCGKVTRIGHSASLVQMWLASQDEVTSPSWVPDRDRAEIQLRVAGPKTLEYLEDCYNQKDVERWEALIVSAGDDADKKARKAAENQLKQDYAQGPPVRRRPELRLYEGYARPRPAQEQATGPGTVFSPQIIVRTLERESGPYRELDLLCAPQVAQRWRDAILTKANDLVEEAANRARKFVDSKNRRVAVMLNRVATAGRIADALRDDAGDRYDVVLLTGRLRPYERDQIVERWKPFLKAREPAEPPKPIILVTTQCLEVGADFSFDALVTEAASLDALRQRFGRLDRMGTAKTSFAVILIRDRDADPEKAEADPVYGHALAKTWKLLTDKAGERSIIDFGVERLREALEDIGDPEPYLAPTPDAPVLLPAHLDLVCQTAPTPHPEPDVQQYLHGIGRGAPEVHVVWRADLGDDEQEWVETVATCRPVSGEMLAAPLWRVRAWLSRAEPLDSTGDVEGVVAAADDGHGDLRPCLLWRGRAKSKVARAPEEIVLGDVVVVPAAYGMEGLVRPGGAEALGRERVDLWEPALESAGRPAALRLHRAVVEPWMKCEPVGRLVEFAEAPWVEPAGLWEAIDAVLAFAPAAEGDAPAPPSWWRDILRAVRTGRIERHPAGGLVLFERAARARSSEWDLFADDDDLTCVSSGAQSLDEHTLLVRQTVEKLAERCLPDSLRQVTAEAASWHDCGKLDERFQILLNHGDELVALTAKQSLAKSALIQASPAERRALREASGLPESFRHEMLSTHLADVHAAKPDDPPLADLLLHLIASHHGHARPLAPVIDDPEPPSIEGRLGTQTISLSGEDRRRWVAHRVDSGLADRFWRLTRRYGWWGLAYLEAIFRLADWYASDLRVQNSSGEEAQP